MSVHYDFCGYATKNDLLCSDGRTIRRDAFKECDGKTVPIVWNHIHNDPEMVIGHGLLENRKDGVFVYGKLNDTEKGLACKKILENHDITGLSIYANSLQHKGKGNVVHGTIREVSLVIAGANPGALIDYSMAHGEDGEDEVTCYLYGDEYTEFQHGDIEREDDVKKVDDDDELLHADGEGDDSDGGKTVEEVFNSMTDEQKSAVYAIVAAITEGDEGEDDEEDDEEDDDEGDEKVKHNVFDNDDQQYGTYLSHSDRSEILRNAQRCGSFREAMADYFDMGVEEYMAHAEGDFQSSGFVQDPNTSGNVTWLFPEYKDLRPGAPELITNDQGWVGTVMSKVNKAPFSRVRTGQVDIRNIESLMGKGYQKGKKKELTGNFTLVRRTHDPQTVYVKSQLHRDDIIDIEWDYVQYLYNIDRMNLNETLAMAFMLGDFRDDSAEDKIFPAHIQPIWTDDELYTLHRDIDIAAARASLQGTDTASYFGDNYVYAEALIEQSLYLREDFRGTGTPDFYMTPHLLNVMLLARDRNGRRIFRDKAELASALNVNSIVTAEQFANRTRTDTNNHAHRLLGIMVNMADYTVGATKGGQITHFTQFDIDYNGQKSLLETRCSGALTRVYSAAVLEEPVA